MTALAAPSTLDRLWRDFRALVRGELVELSFLGTYEVSVDEVFTEADGSFSISGSCTDPSVTIPPVSHCPPLPGLLAEVVQPVVGMLAAVQFLNGKASNPRVVSYYGTGVPAMINILASAMNLGDTSGSPVARVNDTIAVIFPPLIQFSATLSAPPGFAVGVMTITQPAVGVIQTGSSKVKAGG